MHHAVKQPKKNVSPENQDLTIPNLFWKGYKICFEYKNNNYYYFIITIVLYSLLYQILLPDAPCIKILMA